MIHDLLSHLCLIAGCCCVLAAGTATVSWMPLIGCAVALLAQLILMRRLSRPHKRPVEKRETLRPPGRR